MTLWHCGTTVTDFSLAWQKVAVAQHASPFSELSGVRLHVLGNYLHLTATDDNVRGAIYHLRVQGSSNFWAIAPADFLALLERTFEPTDEIRIGTDGSTIIVHGPGDRRCSATSGTLDAFTLGCFAGRRSDWRTIEPDTYWLKGNVRPVESVMLHGRRIEQQYDNDMIFDEVYDEYEDDASWTPDPQDVQPGSAPTGVSVTLAATAAPAVVSLPSTAQATTPRPDPPTRPTSPGLPTVPGTAPSVTPTVLPARTPGPLGSPSQPGQRGASDISRDVSRALTSRGVSTSSNKGERQ